MQPMLNVGDSFSRCVQLRLLGSVMLGHSSIKVTEKHYSPWVRARQEQLEADVKRSWDRDPLVLAQTKGTPEVHEIEEVVN